MTHLLEEDPNDPCITLSEYIDVNTFGKQLSQLKSKLSILSLNIQTINTKFDELKIILDNINQHHPISVICLQDTHLDDNDSTLSFELNDYQLISKSRYCSKAGGLIIYIHNDFNFKHVDILWELKSEMLGHGRSLENHNIAQYTLLWLHRYLIAWMVLAHYWVQQ